MVKAVLRWLRDTYGAPANYQKVVEDYRARFGGNVESPALEDLRRFCYVYDTTSVPGDLQASANNEGRRQVYMHIAQVLNLSNADLEAPKPEPEKDSRDEPRPPMDDD